MTIKGSLQMSIKAFWREIFQVQSEIGQNFALGGGGNGVEM